MVEVLSNYLDEDLDERLRLAIRSHGYDCPPCRLFIRTLEMTVQAVRGLADEPLPASARKTLLRALRSVSA